jgi:hypothetical protein
MAMVNANNGYALNMLNLNLSNETTYGYSDQILSNITDV